MELRAPVRLAGRWVDLVPLERSQADGLARWGDDADVWRYLPYPACPDAPSMARLIDTLLEREARGTDLVFAVELAGHGPPIGMTRYLEIDREHKRLEIGGTWYGRPFRRTPVNTEAKLLLLRHAFEVEGANRVQFKTDLRNLSSQAALERLGAEREGVLRDHMVMPDGYVRSSAIYSLVAREWPRARSRLEALRDRPWPEGSLALRAAGTSADASRGTR